MRDIGDRPNSARYARGGSPRPPAGRRAGAAGTPARAGEASASGALSPAGRRALVAEKFTRLGTLQPDWSQLREYTLATIEEALIERQVPPENLTEPRLEVAAPALEAMRYSDKCRAFALLIASTMDLATADAAHPAFVEILKQLTLDETSLLASLPTPGQAMPMANLYHLDRAGHVRASLRRIIPASLAARCSRRGAIPGYIDNLMRLSLIDTPQRLRIDDERLYRDLLAQPFVADHCARLASVLQPRIERAVLTLTDFGSQFRQCCIETAEPPARMTGA